MGSHSHRLIPTRAVALVALANLMGSCALLPRSPAADPSADFAAHPGYRGLVVDRMDGRQTAILRRTHSMPSTAPTHVLEARGATIAALWINDHDRVTVRPSADAAIPATGEVLAAWRDGAMRLAFRTADGTAFHTSRFERIDGNALPHVLDRELYPVLDLPGIYRAELRDPRDAPMGWICVRILPYQGLPRDFAADVPDSLNGPLTVGAVALLDAEIDTIIARNAFPSDRIPEGLVP